MLFYGTIQNVKNINLDECIVFNFTSLTEDYPNIGLMPPNSLGLLSGLDFDLAYMHYIMDDDEIFCRFMNIMMNIYYGRSVYLIISNDNWSELLIESLLKLIQQRYNLNGYRIESFDDYVYAEASDINSFGLFNIDQDKERWTYIQQTNQMKMQGHQMMNIDDYYE